jgi:nucleotide-binding universal stress UspA family protein
MTKQKIVVGIEGTPAARAALEWAFREALIRGCPVVVVHAWGPTAGRDLAPDQEAMRASATMLVAAVAEAGRAVGGRPEVIERNRRGVAAKVLVEESVGADLLVVGRGHRAGVVDVVGQSVSAECVRHAACPVVVIPAPASISESVPGSVAAGVSGAS